MKSKTIPAGLTNRLGGHCEITIFLDEAEDIKGGKFNVSEQLHLLIESYGEVLACEN
jgi:hypothetical protein